MPSKELLGRRYQKTKHKLRRLELHHEEYKRKAEYTITQLTQRVRSLEAKTESLNAVLESQSRRSREQGNYG